jgi:lysophospholipase L1-like esterase
MPRISSGVPAFASSSANYQVVAGSADDSNMQTSWQSTALPAWIAYDLSGAPAAERENVLLVWNARYAGTYLNATAPSGSHMPTAYTIEINSAPGGTSAPPTDGWTQVAAVTNNLRNTVEHPFSLAGGNWVRMSISGSTDSYVSIDVDVFSTPNGATDAWMFMGDSITYITMGYVFSDLPQLVHQARTDRWPAAINAAIGGTTTVQGVTAFDTTITGFPGRYVVLAYGTNDNPTMFEMETLIQKVIAAGKVPVVPHMPWSALSNIQTTGPMINAQIDALYAKYPQVVRGPDLWAAFTNRTDLIPANDVHPNSAGQEFLRQQWATMMATIP